MTKETIIPTSEDKRFGVHERSQPEIRDFDLLPAEVGDNTAPREEENEDDEESESQEEEKIEVETAEQQPIPAEVKESSPAPNGETEVVKSEELPVRKKAGPKQKAKKKKQTAQKGENVKPNKKGLPAKRQKKIVSNVPAVEAEAETESIEEVPPDTEEEIAAAIPVEEHPENLMLSETTKHVTKSGKKKASPSPPPKGGKKNNNNKAKPAAIGAKKAAKAVRRTGGKSQEEKPMVAHAGNKVTSTANPTTKEKKSAKPAVQTARKPNSNASSAATAKPISTFRDKAPPSKSKRVLEPENISETYSNHSGDSDNAEPEVKPEIVPKKPVTIQRQKALQAKIPLVRSSRISPSSPDPAKRRETSPKKRQLIEVAERSPLARSTTADLAALAAEKKLIPTAKEGGLLDPRNEATGLDSKSDNQAARKYTGVHVKRSSAAVIPCLPGHKVEENDDDHARLQGKNRTNRAKNAKASAQEGEPIAYGTVYDDEDEIKQLQEEIVRKERELARNKAKAGSDGEEGDDRARRETDPRPAEAKPGRYAESE